MSFSEFCCGSSKYKLIGVPENSKKYYTWWQMLLLLIITVFFTVLNNLSASMMSYVMPAYPSWLLYATTTGYTLCFFILAVLLKEDPLHPKNRTTKKLHHYLWLGILTSLNGVSFQFSTAWVDGDLTQILTNCGIPVVFILSYFWLGHKYDARKWIGAFFVIGGVLVGLVPAAQKMIVHGLSNQSEGSNLPWWILCFAFSAIVQDIEQVFQELAFKDHCKPATTLFYYNLISIPAYLLMIPLETIPYLNGTHKGVSLEDSFSNQWHAFRCAFGFPYQEDTLGLNANCQPLAWLWPLMFIVAYMGYFYFNAILIRDTDALYAVLVGAIVPPLVALFYIDPTVVGKEHTAKFSIFVGLSFFLIFIGLLVRGGGGGSESEQELEEGRSVNRSSKEEEESLIHTDIN